MPPSKKVASSEESPERASGVKETAERKAPQTARVARASTASKAPGATRARTSRATIKSGLENSHSSESDSISTASPESQKELIEERIKERKESEESEELPRVRATSRGIERFFEIVDSMREYDGQGQVPGGLRSNNPKLVLLEEEINENMRRSCNIRIENGALSVGREAFPIDEDGCVRVNARVLEAMLIRYASHTVLHESFRFAKFNLIRSFGEDSEY